MEIGVGEMRKRREALGLSLEELSETTGTPKVTLERFEMGERPVPGWVGLVLNELEHEPEG